MQEPPWMPRTEAEYQQQLAEDVGPQPDEMVRLQQALDAAEQEIERLRLALDKAAGRLGYLSTVLSLSKKTENAKGALEWSEEGRAALEG